MKLWIDVSSQSRNQKGIFNTIEIKFIGGISGGEVEGTMGSNRGDTRFYFVLKRFSFRKYRYNGYWISLNICGCFSYSHNLH